MSAPMARPTSSAKSNHSLSGPASQDTPMPSIWIHEYLTYDEYLNSGNNESASSIPSNLVDEAVDSGGDICEKGKSREQKKSIAESSQQDGPVIRRDNTMDMDEENNNVASYDVQAPTDGAMVVADELTEEVNIMLRKFLELELLGLPEDVLLQHRSTGVDVELLSKHVTVDQLGLKGCKLLYQYMDAVTAKAMSDHPELVKAWNNFHNCYKASWLVPNGLAAMAGMPALADLLHYLEVYEPDNPILGPMYARVLKVANWQGLIDSGKPVHSIKTGNVPKIQAAFEEIRNVWNESKDPADHLLGYLKAQWNTDYTASYLEKKGESVESLCVSGRVKETLRKFADGLSIPKVPKMAKEDLLIAELETLQDKLVDLQARRLKREAIMNEYSKKRDRLHDAGQGDSREAHTLAHKIQSANHAFYEANMEVGYAESSLREKEQEIMEWQTTKARGQE